MKIVLAFEGMDGSGKTSLTQFVRRLCEQQGQRYTGIGRREGGSSALVGRFTSLLHDEATTLTPQAEISTRIAREYQRAALAAAAPSGVVVLDRFVLSTLALARFHGVDAEPVVRILQDVAARAQLYATVLVTCPFELGRARVRERSQGMVFKRTRDDRVLRRMAESMTQDFERGLVTGQQWLVDNSDALEAAQEQLAGYLSLHLPKTQNGDTVARAGLTMTPVG
jgi:thymidylate kinase